MARRPVVVSRELAEGAAKFSAWRRRRRRGTRIPDSLWSLAVSLAKRHGVSATAIGLGVDYYSLRDRVGSGVSVSSSERAGAPTPSFVELPAPLFGGACDGVLELRHDPGRSLRMQWRGPTAPDLAALSRDFWESR